MAQLSFGHARADPRKTPLAAKVNKLDEQNDEVFKNLSRFKNNLSDYQNN